MPPREITMDERQQSGKSGVRSDSQKHATANRGGEHTVPPAMPVEGAHGVEREGDHSMEKIGGGDKAEPLGRGREGGGKAGERVE
jgi:hypothetical protein